MELESFIAKNIFREAEEPTTGVYSTTSGSII